jgi:hypothetical protein
MYVRTPDPRDVISVRLISGDGLLAETQAPVRVVPYAAAARLNVCGPYRDVLTDRRCDVEVTPSALPTSWRGLDAADTVWLLPEEIASLTATQRRGLELHAAQAPLLQNGLGTPTVGPVPDDREWHTRSIALLGGFVLAVVLVLSAVRLRGAGGTVAAIAVCSGLGSVAVLGAGRIGPGASIVVHHAASVDQYEGADSSLLTMRGVAEFPAFGDYVLRSDLEDATLFADDATGSMQIDAAGFPTLSGRYGLGETRPFRLEAVAPATLVRVDRVNHDVQLTNVSRLTLKDCAFVAAGTRVTRELPPGAAISGSISDEDADPAVTCTIPEIPWRLSERQYPVVMHGPTALVIHLKASDRAAAGSDR